MEKKFQRVGELFCGPGGGGIGASQSSYSNDEFEFRMKHVWATDIDSDSCQTYLKNISEYERDHFGFNEAPSVIHGDINDENIDLRNAKQFPSIDGLIFGFPCNDYSLVGESKGLNGKYGPLYKHGIAVLNRDDKPDWFIAENVSGLSSSNDGKAFSQILTEMIDAGYDIAPHKYRFEEYGIPQARHRIIIVGIKKSLGIKFKVPAPTGVTRTARQALENIPIDASHQELTKQSKQVVERLRHIKPGENAWNANIPEHLKLNVPRTKLSHIYKRIDPAKPSYTVTGSGGGGTHMYHWDEPRALTNRERARLQTFPDWFHFTGSKESIRKQIGMAIPPEGMRLICNALLSSLNDGIYNFVEPNIKLKDWLT
ncbi:MAG: DNA cytosine methyltransferase [Candidatus Puniceispirillaceae bacterium]